jgi:hypothetical protein
VLVPAEIVQGTRGYDLATIEVVTGEAGDAGDQVVATLPGEKGRKVVFRQHSDPVRWVAHLPDGGSLHVAGAHQVPQALDLAGAGTIPVPAGEPIDATALRRSA